jgi:hypothetical protein
MRYKAIAARPYPNPLRGRVLALLTQLGVEVEVPVQLEGAATNDEVAAFLRGRRPDLLLIPFHAQRDRQDERTSGLDLVAKLRAEVPDLREVQVFMPVSVFGRVAFEAAWKTAALAAVEPLFEEDLEDAAVLPRLLDTLRRQHRPR